MIERHIDYLQFSALLSEHDLIEKNYEQIAPPRFYKRGYKSKHGTRVFFGNPNSKLALVVSSGEALQNMRDIGIWDEKIVGDAIELGANISRLDLAVTEWNTFEGFLAVDDVIGWVRGGKIESSLLDGGVQYITSIEEKHDTHETLYVGSMENRAKRGIFRAYDKGIQLDLGEYMATRLELELKREKAHNTAIRIAEGAGIAPCFRASFDVRDKEFERIMEAPALKVSRGKGKEKSTEEQKMDSRWKWLMEQVAPALKEAREWDIEHRPESPRFYFFLREAGMTHSQIIRMVAELRELWQNQD